MRLDSGLPLSSAGNGCRHQRRLRRVAEIRDADVLQERTSSPTFLRRRNRWAPALPPLSLLRCFHFRCDAGKGVFRTSLLHIYPSVRAGTGEGRLRGRNQQYDPCLPSPLLPLGFPCSSLIFPSPPCVFFFPPVPSLSLSLVCSLSASPSFAPCALNTNIPSLPSLPVLKTY